MKHILPITLAALAACLPAVAQRDARYDFSVVPQVRIDMRDLGYPPVDVIPSGESAIRALAVAPDGKIYGATSGDRSHLFVLDPRHGYVVPLGRLPGNTVHHSVTVSPEGDVYIGTSLPVDNNGEGYANYAGGHLLKYTPSAPGRRGGQGIQIEKDCPVQDLGVAVKGQGIYALVAHPTWGLYGVTYPDGEVFSFDAKTGVFKNRGRVSKAKMPGEKFENEKNIGRALAVGKDGNVYTSGDGNFCQVGLGEVKELKLSVPTVPGREVYSRVDAWAQDEAGNLYGGSSDGYLFRFDTERMRVQNLGKPLSQYRIRGLVASPNGKLYGIGGDNDDMARLFSYDPSTGAYDVLGMIDVNRRPYYGWQGYVFDSMAIGKDGTVYMGQAERKSKLYLFYPN